MLFFTKIEKTQGGKNSPNSITQDNIRHNVVPICVMTRNFRGKITQKILDFFKKILNFSGNFTPKSSGHDVDCDTISHKSQITTWNRFRTW